MKIGIRKPNIKKSIKARTTGKIKRQVKKAVNPMYGKKGMGVINDPKKAVYNKVYNKTTVGVSDVVRNGSTHGYSSDTKTNATAVTHKYSPTTYKVAGIIAIVCSVIIIFLSLLLLLAVPGVGVVFAILGVFFFVLGKAYTKKAKVCAAPKIDNVFDCQTTPPQTEDVKQPMQLSASVPAPTTQQQPKLQTIPESEKNYNLFYKHDVNNGTYLAYTYEENLAFPATSVLTGNGGKIITFKQEPDNEYDNKAIAVYLNDIKVGYLYRGRIQDMVNDWISKNDPFWGYVNKVDTANDKATIKIGFYKSTNNLLMKKFRLIRITKKVVEFGNSRYDNVGGCSDGDTVEYTSSFDNDNYIITDECGEELGEVSAKAVEFIDEHEDNIKFMRINNIEDTDSGGYKADIEVFYKE